jgi:hypothetical protein
MFHGEYPLWLSLNKSLLSCQIAKQKTPFVWLKYNQADQLQQKLILGLIINPSSQF